MKRPMIIWVSLFILGEIMSLRLSSVQMILCFSGVLVVLAGTPFFFKEWNLLHRKLWLLGGVFLLFGICNTELTKNRLEWMKFCYSQNVSFSGKVMDIEEKTKTTCYIVKTDYITAGKENCTYPVKIQIKCFDSDKGISEWADLKKGDIIYGKGYGQPFETASNPGGYDEASYQHGKGVYLSLEQAEIYKIIRPSLSIPAVLSKIRNRFTDIFYVCLQDKDGSLAAAMVLGDKKGLNQDVKELYQRNGIAHLIAISGLHIAMIGGILYSLLRKLLGGYVIPVGCGIGFILLYGMMTGLSGATLRAVIMLAVHYAAQLLGRRYDILTAVSFSLFLMLLYNPFQITQAGFLLSYGAILGIGIVNPVWKLLFPKLPKWSDGFFVSFSVQLCLTPVMLYYFYEIPVYSIFLNLIVVPVMSVLLFFLLISGLSGLFSIQLAVCISYPAKWIFRLYELLCNINENMPGSRMCMGRPSSGWIAAYYGIIIFFLLVVYGRDSMKLSLGRTRTCQLLLMVMLSVCFLFVYPFAAKGNLMISMFDVGQGDGIFIRTPHHRNILIDGGSSTKQNVGTYVLENGLKYYGCASIDYALITHSDKDHYSGIKELLENDSITIKNLILPDIANPDDSYHELENLASQKNCKLIYMVRGDSFIVDDVSFYCLNPQNRAYEDKNTGSLVFLLKYMDFDMLFTGDMDAFVEEELIEEKKQWLTQHISGKLDVLKVAHHGSKTASTGEFVELLNPEASLISVGENNRYGHPNEETLQRLQEEEVQIFRTDEGGQIEIQIKNNGKVSLRQFMDSQIKDSMV